MATFDWLKTGCLRHHYRFCLHCEGNRKVKLELEWNFNFGIIDWILGSCVQKINPMDSNSIQCRVCMQHTYECISLEAPLSDETEMTISDSIRAVSSISCTLEDGLPYLICDNCIDELVRTFKFIAKIQESDTILRQDLCIKQDFEQIVEESTCVIGTEEILVEGIVYETLDGSYEILVGEDQQAQEEEQLQQKIEKQPMQKLQEHVSQKNKPLPTKKTEYEKLIIYRDGVKMYKCTGCDKVFKRRDYLSNHIRFVHKKVRPFLCSMCRKSYFFCSTSKLYNHSLQLTATRIAYA